MKRSLEQIYQTDSNPNTTENSEPLQDQQQHSQQQHEQPQEILPMSVQTLPISSNFMPESASSLPPSHDYGNIEAETNVNHSEEESATNERPVPPELHAWVDIFAASKLVICMNPRNVLNPNIMIQHAQKEFLHNFGFVSEQLPLPLKSIFGNSTERSKVIRLEQSLLTGRNFTEFVNFHKSNGGSLSCHITLLCLTTQTESPSTSSTTSPMLTSSSQFPSITMNNSLKYGILTIRSASVVGNSRYSGIGLMGTDRVSRERIQEIPQPIHNNPL